MKKHMTMALCWLPIILFSGISHRVEAQTHRIGVGLTFGSVINYNTGETGNPGFSVIYWHELNRAGNFHLVPSVTFYTPYSLKTGYSNLSNFLIQADLNLQYGFFHQGPVRIVVFGGGNYTQLVSNFTPIVVGGDQEIEDMRDNALGGNLGAGLELYMSPRWDFNVAAKYILSDYSQVVLSVQAAYYFIKRKRAFRR